MKKLENRVAVVTGAGSGIGQATAELLSRKGCRLALVDINQPGLEETKRKLSGPASIHNVDVSDKQRMQELPAQVVAEHGAVHVLVNNAGVAVGKLFSDHSVEDFEWLFSINFWGVVYGCKFFLPEMLKQEEGHIVNISSVFGLIGMPLNSSYCASKFAVRGLSESLRAELSESRVGVTSVHPGGIATNIVKSARFAADEDSQTLHKQTMEAFKHMLPPSKAARVIVNAIRSNKARALIAREAYAIDLVKRVFPVLTGEIIGMRWKKGAESMLQWAKR